MSDANITELIQTAALFKGSNSHVELRCVGNGRTLSGIFETPDAAAKYALSLDGVRNTYIVANSIRSDFRRGTFGRISAAGPGDCVSDNDIERRQFLPIDFDSKSKGKNSATNEEIADARAVAVDVQAFLTSLGWAEPTLGFSGNGNWLFYPIDLPNTPEIKALVDRVLEVLALRFNTATVQIDLTASNAARLVPYFGTMKMKGESTASRPHRRSSLESVTLGQNVTLAQLQAFAGSIPSAGEAAPPAPAGKGFRKLEAILDEAGVQHTEGKVVRDVTWYGVMGPDGNCPFGDSSGNGGKCGVGQDKSGKLYGHCFAADHPWPEWKEILKLGGFFSGTPHDGLPTVLTSGKEMNVISKELWAAVVARNDPPTLFAFGNTMVEVVLA